MNEKLIQTLHIQQHDIEKNWRVATDFIPKKGQLIVYDIDAKYSYERFKIGDGVTLVNDLPFATEIRESDIPDTIARVADLPDYTQPDIDDIIAQIPTPDVSGQINDHNTATDAHGDIRESITKLTNTVNDITVPTKVSDLTNDSGYITSVPVSSVNGKTGKVSLSASDVGADATGTANANVSTHNTATDAHGDIRIAFKELTTRLNTVADSDDATLDQLSEVVSYIKSNKTLIDSITTSKINVADIVNDLTTNISNKPLSAAQGVALKALIDVITVPTKVSDLTNDSGYLTSYTETDPTVPAWAKADTKPTYTSSEVGAVPASRTVNGKALTEDIILTAADIGSCLPNVTADDDGKFLRVVDGAWAIVGLPNAEEASF